MNPYTDKFPPGGRPKNWTAGQWMAAGIAIVIVALLSVIGWGYVVGQDPFR